MNFFTENQVIKLLKKQRENCMKSVRKQANGKKIFDTSCLNAKEPKFSEVLFKIKSKNNKHKTIDWGKVSYNLRLKNKNLTQREGQILIYICQGLSSKKIAKKFKLSEKTIETHRRNIYIKINVKNAIQLINAVHYFNK